MFQWLTKQFRPFFVRGKELVSGQEARRARNTPPLPEEPSLLAIHSDDPFWARRESRRKRQLLELRLEDAEWILAYEKRLTKLRKKTTAQRSRAEQAEINTERLRRLEHHLAELRRNLSLD